MYLTHVCLWTTLLSVVVTWAISHVSNRRKKTTKLTDTTAGQERRYGGPDVIIVGAGVGGSALAYALAKNNVLLVSSCVRLEEGTVKSLIEEKGVIKGVTYKNSSGEETTAFAPLTVAEVMSYQVGYISKNCQLEEPEYLHLVMAKPSFTMMYQLSSTEVRCGVELFPGQIPSIANGDMTNFLRNTMAPQVPPKLRKIFLKGIDEGAQIKVMPTKRMAATLSDKKGAIVLGDAFNMRHPSIASGMMVLLSDILILRCLLQPLDYLGDTNKVSEVIKSFYVIRKPMSATVNTLGTAFSQVLIASTDKAKEAMRQGCYDYLSSGGFGASGLMALLGGMNPRPLSLIFHLFVVTLSATVQLLSPFPSPLGIWHSLRLLGLSMKMLVPHLKAEGVSQMLFPAYAAVYRKTYMTATTI
ncbi:hypothetical protein Bca4012_032009 [Brassica carinata]